MAPELSRRPVRDVFRAVGWPASAVAKLPDVTLGRYLSLLEQPGLMAPPQPLPPQPLPTFAYSGVVCDPVENAKAAMRYVRERYGMPRWDAFVSDAYREMLRRDAAPWPLSLAPSSPHGDPMASLMGRR